MKENENKIPFEKLGADYDDEARKNRFCIKAVYSPDGNDHYQANDFIPEDRVLELLKFHGAEMFEDTVQRNHGDGYDYYRFYLGDGTFLLLRDVYSESVYAHDYDHDYLYKDEGEEEDF